MAEADPRPSLMRPEQLPPLDITVIVITFNEALHITRCIERIRDHVARVVVIDSFSTDGTQDMARAAGAEIIEHPFINHAAQFNWGMEAADVRTGWIMRLDADEYLDPPGIKAIRRALSEAGPQVSAFTIRRGVVFAGRRIRFGGIGKVFLTRLWRTGTSKLEARWMDEQVLVHQRETRHIGDGAIIDENINDIGWWTAKHNGYTTRQMVQWMLDELGGSGHVDTSQLNVHVRRKRFMRKTIYAPAPLFLRPIAYFIYRYIFALGFLDGRAGFLFHFFQGLWNFFLVDVKIYEAREVVASGGAAAFRDWLARTYGIELSEWRSKPTVAVMVAAAWPDNDASGPVQSIRQIAPRLTDTARFELFAPNGAPGEKPLVAHRTRIEEVVVATTYLHVGPMGARNLISELRRLQPDWIWLNSMWDREFSLPVLLARRLGLLGRARILLSTRGEFSKGALALKPGRKRAMLAALRAGGFLKGVTLHVTGATEAADVARAIPEGVIFNADNLRSLPPLPPHSEPDGGPLRLLFLGRISPVKGLHNALAALARTKSAAHLTIHGPVHDRDYATRCHALADSLPKHISVEWAGPVANRDSARAYAAADLFLNPSASENFGHTIFEALACGTPVVTGLHTPWNDLEADRAGFNRSSDDASALAAAIDWFAELPSEARAQWRAGARARAERFVATQGSEERWRSWLASPAEPMSGDFAELAAT